MAGFNDIYGQDAVKEFMQKALAAGQIPHACILSGEKSSGKEFIAGIFARALQCENGGAAALRKMPFLPAGSVGKPSGHHPCDT